MHGETKNRSRPRTLQESIEVDADVARVFSTWEAYEDWPHFMESIRRTKCIDERRVLWDVDIAGHQLVWAARIVAREPGRMIRWESTWGVRNDGEVRFEPLRGARTRVTLEVRFRPRGLIEHLGARFGVAERHLRSDLARFREHVERATTDAAETAPSHDRLREAAG